MKESTFPPIRQEIVVEAPPERAFRIFTDGFDKWWPREHHIGKTEMARAVMEPGVGGRWYELSVDGSQCDWGKVLVWDPPRRLVLAWQLNGEWEYDPEFVTELELRFTAVGGGRTRVELEHRNIDKFGEKAATTRDALDSPAGWSGGLALFAAVAQSDTEDARDPSAKAV
jgi:uncharacterized protein YndB with AHSA1/START domain